MKSGMNSLHGNKRLRFHCALAFLVWSLLPHYFLVLHSHAGGERDHAHAGLSREDVEGARHGHSHESPYAYATEAGAGTSLPSDPPDAGGAHPKASKAGEDLHGHIGEDPNLAGEALQAVRSESVSGLPSEAAAGYRSPSLPEASPLGARGPPTRIFLTA